MTANPPTAVLLRAAADWIDTHGWARGTMRTPDGAVCALGAIRAVAPPTPLRQVSDGEHACTAALVVRLHLTPAPGANRLDTTPAGLVTAWNDQAASADQVTAAIRAAAQEAAR